MNNKLKIIVVLLAILVQDVYAQFNHASAIQKY
jgi:hypothetical protein